MRYEGPTRFYPDATADYAVLKDAAVRYVANLPSGAHRGLVEKPLDWRVGHPTYFTAMLQLLSALRSMDLPPGARIIEVGSGAGWATEILASLWYRVDCIEPSKDMIDVAKRRVRDYLRLRGAEHFLRRVTWQASTVEEAHLEPGTADAVLFFESFHHVVDEKAALEKAIRALRPGGCLVILGDSNWIPGNHVQEAAWAEEMAAFGTLESPFTEGYLTWILQHKGFVDIQRCHLVNGLVPTDRDSEVVRNFALMDATWVNLVIARKPSGELSPTPADQYPYGLAVDDTPPADALNRARRAAADGLRRLASLIGGA